MRLLGILVALFGLALAIVAFNYARQYDPADSPESKRFAAGVLLSELSINKKAVEDYAKEHDTLKGVNSVIRLQVDSTESAGVNLLLASDDGVMTAIDKNLEVTVILQPKLEGGLVVWSCQTLPSHASPSTCLGGKHG